MQPIWIAVPAESFVMMEDDRDRVPEDGRLLQDHLADPGVLDHGLPFDGRERGRLLQDLLGKGQLADVVEQGREADTVDLGVGKTEAACHPNRQRGDQRGRMAPVVRVRRKGGDERLLRGQPGELRDVGRARPAISGDRRARDPGVVAWLGEDVDLVAPERLRRVHGRVRVPDELVDMEVAPEAPGHADGDSHLDGELVVDPEPRPADQHAQLVGERGRVLHVGLREDEHELLAAVSAEHVRRPQVRPEHVGDAAQHNVARVVAVGVVDRLEEVDVDEADRERSVVAGGPLDLPEEHAQQGRAIGDPGQTVDSCRVVRGRKRGAELGHRASQPSVDAAVLCGYQGRELAVGEALSRSHHRDHVGPDPQARDRRGEGGAQDRGSQQRARLQPAGRRKARRAHEEPQGEEGDGSQQPQPAEGAYHAATVPAGPAQSARPEGTAGYAGSPGRRCPPRLSGRRPLRPGPWSGATRDRPDGGWYTPGVPTPWVDRPPRRSERLSEAGISVTP